GVLSSVSKAWGGPAARAGRRHRGTRAPCTSAASITGRAGGPPSLAEATGLVYRSSAAAGHHWATWWECDLAHSRSGRLQNGARMGSGVAVEEAGDRSVV